MPLTLNIAFGATLLTNDTEARLSLEPDLSVNTESILYESVLNTLSADEFNIIRSYIASLGDHTIKMSYQYPQFECPKCHQKTEVIPMQAENMVFTRYQLATLVTTVLK